MDNLQKCPFCGFNVVNDFNSGQASLGDEPVVLPCLDCATHQWMPFEMNMKPGRYYDIDHGMAGIDWKVDCWSVGIDEDTGVEIGRRVANCRLGGNDQIIYGANCSALPGATHWRLIPGAPTER